MVEDYSKEPIRVNELIPDSIEVQKQLQLF